MSGERTVFFDPATLAQLALKIGREGKTFYAVLKYSPLNLSFCSC
jgi:hypothetical protein